MGNPQRAAEDAREVAAKLKAEGRHRDAEKVNRLIRANTSYRSTMQVLHRDNAALRAANTPIARARAKSSATVSAIEIELAIAANAIEETARTFAEAGGDGSIALTDPGRLVDLLRRTLKLFE